MLGGSYLFSWGQYSYFQGSMPPPNPTELGPMLISWCFPRHALWRCVHHLRESMEHRGEAGTGGARQLTEGMHFKGQVTSEVQGLLGCTHLWLCNLLPAFSCPQTIHSCQCSQCSGGAEKKWGLLKSIPLVWGSWEVTSLSLLSMGEIGAERWHTKLCHLGRGIMQVRENCFPDSLQCIYSWIFGSTEMLETLS